MKPASEAKTLSRFQRKVANTRRKFLDPRKLGEPHTVEGKEIIISIDSDRLIELQGGGAHGIAESSLLFFAAVEDLPPWKAPGSAINVDGREYTVDSWSYMMGMVQVIAGQPRAI